MAKNGGQSRVMMFVMAPDKAPLFGSDENSWKIFRLDKPISLFLPNHFIEP